MLSVLEKDDMAEKYVNIKIILDRLMKHPLLQDLSLETVVDYTVDFMRIVGVPKMFYNKVEVITIQDYRAALPCDLHEVIQIRSNKNKEISFRSTTDTFHISDCKNTSYDLTYKIQGDIIYTSIKEGELELSYKAILIDEDGYPMLPDNSSFFRALELYIKKQWFTILFDLNKISPNTLSNTQQEYAWAVGDCQTEFNRLSLDEAESFYNSWRTLIIRDSEHKNNFTNNGSKERIKIH